MHYLKKYVGTYRVKAEYDQETNDFPRDPTDPSKIDPSFDDLYIECQNDIQIKHGMGSMLWCYVPSKSRGINILKKIYIDKVSDKLPKETSKTTKYYDNLSKALVASKVLLDVEVLDFEVIFEFKATMIDYIASIVGAKTKGCTISPFSVKNLPKAAYKIPEEDLKLYDNAIEHLPKKEVVVKDKVRVMVDGLLIKNLNLEFDKVIIKSQPKGFDINADRKLKGLNGKNYIHSFGTEMWRQYCEFLSKK